MCGSAQRAGEECHSAREVGPHVEEASSFCMCTIGTRGPFHTRLFSGAGFSIVLTANQ